MNVIFHEINYKEENKDIMIFFGYDKNNYNSCVVIKFIKENKRDI